MNWTLADLVALDKAIALGVKRVEYHDKNVEYRSLDDMLRIRRIILAYLQPAAAKRGRVYASVSKGTY